MFVTTKNKIKKATYGEIDNGFIISGKDVMINKDKTTYCKQINIPTNGIAKLYNNKGICVGVEVYDSKELIQENIVIPSKRMCRVILHRDGKKFIGSAKCRMDEEFDATKGIEIAETRAIIKRNQYKLEKLIK